jgi:hypothetical protein
MPHGRGNGNLNQDQYYEIATANGKLKFKKDVLDGWTYKIKPDVKTG